jgi:hypothetical protein
MYRHGKSAVNTARNAFSDESSLLSDSFSFRFLVAIFSFAMAPDKVEDDSSFLCTG